MKNNALPLIMSRIFNVPLMIDEQKLDVILWALKDRMGLDIPEVLVEDAPERHKVSMEEKRGATKGNSGSVAIIPVHDTLVHRHTIMQSYSGMTSYLFVRSAFRKAMASKDVAAIVLHIDSPGGEAAGVQDLAREIYSARGKKPILASVEGYATSAAYYIASAADSIFMTESSRTGSIGVIAKHIDESSSDEKKGLKVTTFYAGARKNDFSPHEPLSDQARARGMQMVNEMYNLFVRDVALHRGLSEEDVRKTEAAIFSGEKAIAAKLVDKIGTLDDAIGAALATPFQQSENINTKQEDKAMPWQKQFEELSAKFSEMEAKYTDLIAKHTELERSFSAQGAELEAEKKKTIEAAEAQRKAKLESDKASFAEMVEGFIAEGKVLAAEKDGLLAEFAEMQAIAGSLTFADDEKDLNGRYKKRLSARPVLISQGKQFARVDNVNTKGVDANSAELPAAFAAIAGEVIEESLDQHNRIQNYADANGVSYEVAAQKVMGM